MITFSVAVFLFIDYTFNDKVVVYQTTEELERLKQLTDVKYCYDVHDKHALSHYDNWLLQWIEQRD